MPNSTKSPELTELFNNSDSATNHSNIYLSNAELSNLEDDTLHLHLKSTTKSIGSCQENMCQLFEEKKLILSELLARTTCNTKTYKKDIHFVADLICSSNELLNTFLETHKSDNSLLIDIIDNSYERVNIMEIYKEFIEKTHQNLVNEDLFGVIQSGIEENKSLIKKISNLVINQQSRSTKNIPFEVELNTAHDERDETREDNKILRHSLYHQTKVIAELNYENRQLKERIKNNSISENNPSSPSASLSIQIEPLRRVCANYNQELRRSVRSLEVLIIAAKSAACSDDVTNEPSFVFEAEMSDIIELCLNSIHLLKSVSHDQMASSDLINLESCVGNLEKIQTNIQHILAQMCCDESLV